jgi:hypothetical protein
MLDVSKNISLTKLECSNNQLKALEVGENATLVELMCHANQLSESALNVLFESLPVCLENGGTLGVLLNPGSNTADESLAIGKGWKIRRFL